MPKNSKYLSYTYHLCEVQFDIEQILSPGLAFDELNQARQNEMRRLNLAGQVAVIENEPDLGAIFFSD